MEGLDPLDDYWLKRERLGAGAIPYTTRVRSSTKACASLNKLIEMFGLTPKKKGLDNQTMRTATEEQGISQ